MKNKFKLKNMKKITFIFAFMVASTIMFAQPVSDNAIIPMSVSLNSILRLNVVSGGNIEFVVNTISQYTAGVSNSAKYTTTFTVASSVDFRVGLRAEDATFIGTDLVGNTMPLDNIGYLINEDGTGADPANWDLEPFDGAEAVEPLDDTEVFIVTSTGGAGAGDIAKNKFLIKWELATAALILVNTTAETLLAQSLAADRYSTNVWLTLSATP